MSCLCTGICLCLTVASVTYCVYKASNIQEDIPEEKREEKNIVYNI
jgi:hypothetical protein